MTISYVGAGAVGVGTGTVVSAAPSGAATDLVLAFLGNKPFSIAPTQAAYTTLNFVTSGSVANAVSSGSVRATAFQRTTIPTSAVSDTFGSGSSSPAIAQGLRFSLSAGNTWVLNAFGLADTTETGTVVSATASLAASDIKAGDWVVLHVVINDDAPNHTGQTLTIPGCTVGAITWLTKASTTTGNDGAQYVGYAQVTAGSSTASTATYAATSSVSGNSGTAVNLVRIREVVPPNAPTNVSATGDADSIFVDWDTPASGTTPDSYNVYRRNPTNLLTGNDATFTSGVGSWTTTDANCSLSNPSGVLRVTTSATASVGRTTSSPLSAAVVPGDIVEASINYRVAVGSRTASVDVAFFTSAGVFISGSNTVPENNTSSSFTTYQVVAIAPATAAFVRFRVGGIGSTNTGAIGDAFEFDNASLITTTSTSVTAPTTQYDDTTVVSNITYTYYIKAVSSSVEGAASSSVTGSLVTTTTFAAFGVPL